MDGVVRQAGMAVDFRDLARQHGADGAVRTLLIGISMPHRRAAVERGCAFGDQLRSSASSR
jgi:hypothetical protein